MSNSNQGKRLLIQILLKGTGLPSEFELMPKDIDLAIVVQRISKIMITLRSN